jgi:mannan endo-1,4-beta-mannosidase
VPAAAIASGRYDQMIREDARIAARHDGPILLRWAQEMNGLWFPERSADPRAFVASWIRYVEIFRAEGATNVTFVWTPSVEDVAGARPMEPYFPGERYVDYVGLDGYNWGHAEDRSFGEVFAASYERLTRLSSKPVVIGETASPPQPDKGQWIHNGLLRELPRRFPDVVAVLWFSKDMSREGQRDWRIETSQDATTAWREVSASALYSGGPTPLQRLLDVVGSWLGRLAGTLLGH